MGSLYLLEHVQGCLTHILPRSKLHRHSRAPFLGLRVDTHHAGHGRHRVLHRTRYLDFQVFGSHALPLSGNVDGGSDHARQEFHRKLSIGDGSQKHEDEDPHPGRNRALDGDFGDIHL